VPPVGAAKSMTSHSAVSQTGSEGREREINVKLRKHEFCAERQDSGTTAAQLYTIIQLTGCIEDTLYHEVL